MSTIKKNPNDPIHKNALTTKKSNQEEDEMTKQEKKGKWSHIAVNKPSGAPDTGSGDPEDFDAKTDNMHKKR
jgi:hypothetical protein